LSIKKTNLKGKKKKLIGDILVESQVLTVKQKNEVLQEQRFRDLQAEKIFAADQPNKEIVPVNWFADQEVDLSDYEKQFLKIRVLDQEFASNVIEKNFATEREIKIAQKIQEQEFEKKHGLRILGDFMVELDFLSEKQKNLVLEEQERIKSDTKNTEPPDMSITISQDNMEAVVSIHKNAKQIQLKDIKLVLESKGIKYGVYPDAILQCNLDMKNTQFIAARQDVSFELIKNKKVTYHFDTKKIDTAVKKKGVTLAELRINGEPYLKKDLFGKTIEQRGGDEPGVRCGTGVRLSKDQTKAFAGKTGFPSLSIEKKLFVHPAINVLEDADLKYGPLEKFANLNISGVLTGAYPIFAGNINAREIRGARIEAIGSIRTQIGITDASIIAQGDIHARYLHNCRIETFGNVYIENEIIDSQIFCGGKIDSGKCRAITSALYGKKGIELAGAGNKRTSSCIIGAGTEHHVLERARRIYLDIENIHRQVDDLKIKKDEQGHYEKKIFQKMIELKIFHDRAKNKKKKLAIEFKQRKRSYEKKRLKNLVTLINAFEKRMKSSIASLKKMNETKRRHEKEKMILEKKINQLEPTIQKEISKLKIDLFSFLEWTRKQKSLSQIKINKEIYPGTILKGIFSSIEIEKKTK